MAAEDSATEVTMPAMPSDARSLPQALRAHVSLTRVQGVCGLVAALISIGGAFGYFVPARHDHGDVLAIVQDARTGRPVADATVELLTLQDSLVTTLPPAEGAGTAKAPIKEGTYRLRVLHPRYTPESRQIYVLNGQTAQIRVRLAARPVPPPPPPPAPVQAKAEHGPFESLKKLFH